MAVVQAYCVKCKKKVDMEDAKKADKVFDTLMGNEVLPRKKFIQTHAMKVKNLDV